MVPLTKSFNLTEKSNNRIFCNVASGVGPFRFQWFKNDQLLNEKQRIKIDINDEFSILFLKNLTKKDSATYKCQVNNSFGSDSSSTLLIVKGFWFFYITRLILRLNVALLCRKLINFEAGRCVVLAQNQVTSFPLQSEDQNDFFNNIYGILICS